MKYNTLIARTILISSLCFLTACGGASSDVKAKLQFASEQSNNKRNFMVDFLSKLQSSGANNILSIEAHDGQPIVITAKRLAVNAPLNLREIFDSEAFRIQFGDLFPKTTNGWDAFIAFLGTAEAIVGSPVPWLAGALRTVASTPSYQVSGDGNVVSGNNATRSDVIDSNNQTDNSDNSDNSDRSNNSVNNAEPSEPEI